MVFSENNENAPTATATSTAGAAFLPKGGAAYTMRAAAAPNTTTRKSVYAPPVGRYAMVTRAPRLTIATLPSNVATRPGRGRGFQARQARCTVQAASTQAGTARCVLFQGIFSEVQE